MTTKFGVPDTCSIFERTAEVTMDWFYLSLGRHAKPTIFEQLTQGNNGLKRAGRTNYWEPTEEELDSQVLSATSAL